MLTESSKCDATAPVSMTKPSLTTPPSRTTGAAKSSSTPHDLSSSLAAPSCYTYKERSLRCGCRKRKNCLTKPLDCTTTISESVPCKRKACPVTPTSVYGCDCPTWGIRGCDVTTCKTVYVTTASCIAPGKTATMSPV